MNQHPAFCSKRQRKICACELKKKNEKKTPVFRALMRTYEDWWHLNLCPSMHRCNELQIAVAWLGGSEKRAMVLQAYASLEEV